MKSPNGFGSVWTDDVKIPNVPLTNNTLPPEDVSTSTDKSAASDEVKLAIQNAYNKDLYELIEIQKLDGYYYSSKDAEKVIANSKFNQIWFKPGDVWCYKEWTNYSAPKGSTITSQANVQYFVPIGIVKSVLSTGYMPNDIDSATQRRQNPDIINSTRITFQKLTQNAGIINPSDQPLKIFAGDAIGDLLMKPGGKYPVYIIRKNTNQVIEPTYQGTTQSPSPDGGGFVWKAQTSNDQKLPTSNDQKDNTVAIIAVAASVLLLVLILKREN